MVEACLELRSSRLILRPFGADDLTDTYVGWLNDPAVVRFSNQRFQRHDLASCAEYLARFEGSGNLFVAICRAADRAVIGTMTARRSRHHGTADVGIMIGERSVWGQGFGQEAWNTLLGWLAGSPGMRKLTCGTLDCNLAMRRLAERSGMVLEGTRRAQEVVDGEPHDILYFARYTSGT